MNSRNAFSMVELSFVIAIVSLLTVGGLSVGVSVVDQKRHVDTQLQLEEITDALRIFYQVNQRLPCPAPMNAAIDAADFGQEIHAGACATNTATPGATTRISVGGGRFVRSGGVPVRTLGLKESMARDEWFNRFTYVVLEEATDNTELISTLDAFRLNSSLNGVQMVTNTGASIYNQGLFALIGHGPDGKGAYRHKTGSLQSTCDDGSGADDIENCTHSNALVVDTPFNDGELAANFFDDYVSWGGSLMIKSSAEDDPQVGNLTDGMLCVANSGEIVCNATEDDPQVGDVSTSGDWCRSDGSQIICDQSAPTGGVSLSSYNSYSRGVTYTAATNMFITAYAGGDACWGVGYVNGVSVARFYGPSDPGRGGQLGFMVPQGATWRVDFRTGSPNNCNALQAIYGLNIN